MKFAEVFQKSIYSPEFYESLRERPFSFSLKYFYLLGCFAVLIFTVLFSIEAGPFVRSFLDHAGPVMLRAYPEELVITIENGEARTNVEEPYFIHAPPEFGAIGNGTNAIGAENILVVDTQSDFSPARFWSYRTLFFLTKDLFVMKDGEGIRIEPIKPTLTFTLDKRKMTAFADVLAPLARFAIPLVVFGTFVAGMAFWSSLLAYALFLAVLVLLVRRGRRITYGEAYQAALHLLTLGAFVSLMLFLFASRIPYVFTAVFLIAAWLNFPSTKGAGEEGSTPA